MSGEEWGNEDTEKYTLRQDTREDTGEVIREEKRTDTFHLLAHYSLAKARSQEIHLGLPHGWGAVLLSHI